MPVLENTEVLPFSHISIVSPTVVNCIKMSFRHTGKYATKRQVCPQKGGFWKIDISCEENVKCSLYLVVEKYKLNKSVI